MAILFYAHSGLRYLVLLVGVLAAGYTLTGLLASRPFDRAARILVTAFVGLMDVQVLLGLSLWLTLPAYPALYGHIVMMLVAVTVAHGGSLAIRRRERPTYTLAVATVVAALLLIVGGILAIGRPLLGSGGL